MPVPVLGFFFNREVLIFWYISALGDLLVAFQAVPVADRLGQRRGLDGGAGVPLEGILRPQQFGLHPAQHPHTGVTIDAARTLGRVPGCQVDRLAGSRILQVGAFRLCMTGTTETVMRLLGGGEGEPASRDDQGNG